MIRDCVVAAEAFGAASAYVKVTDTSRKHGTASSRRYRTGHRSTTPRRRRRSATHHPALSRAGARRRVPSTLSDDVRLIMDAGTRVRVVEGDYRNIKITNPRDMEIAERIALSWEGPR